MKTDIEHLADLKANPDDKRHGTERGARLGCRCQACDEAAKRMREKARQRMAEKRANKSVREAIRKSAEPPEKRSPKDCCTLNELLLPMMGKHDIDNIDGRCSWCGRPGATNRHHIVRRGAGKLVVGGHEIRKPTVLLCGSGNASGCHGKAHAMKLHFRWVGKEKSRESFPVDQAYTGAGPGEALETSKPVDYQEALDMDGWRRL